MKCEFCNHSLPINMRPDIYHESVIKMYNIIKKNNLKIMDIISLLKISERTFYRWFDKKGHTRKIKSSHFEILMLHGYQ